MHKCDVLIVGGGPAGSTCARALIRAGMHAVILDKQTFPRDKTCAGWITPPIVEELDIDLDDYAASRTLQPITAFRVGMLGAPLVHVTYDRPVSYGIRRCEFDHYLLDRCGAEMRLGESIKSIERAGGQWIVNGEIEAPMLIGAGGHFCPVARHLGAQTSTGNGHFVVAAQEIEFAMNDAVRNACNIEANTPELYFCPDLAGYAWCFRKGDYLNIGLGREDRTSIGDHTRAFGDYLEQQNRIPKGTLNKYHGHAYILYGHARRRIVDEGVCLIGDSAGLAYPQSGEGIRPAVESGLLAATTVIESRGNYNRANLTRYAKRVVARFGRGTPPGSHTILPGVKQQLAAMLLATRWFARHVVINRWFLHRQHAALRG